DSADYIFLNQTRRSFLEGFGGPKDGLGMLAAYGSHVSPGQLARDISAGRLSSPILFLPEVMFDGQALARLDWAKARGFKTAALVYDLIPIFHKEFCDPNVSAGFSGYLTAVLRADSVWSISGFTLDSLARYAAETDQQMPENSET